LMNERVEGLSLLKTPQAWLIQQDKTRAKLETFFGKFGERTPLNEKITGRIEHEKYSIEKLYFESRPNYYVTADLYLPKGRKLPVPAVLFTCGHSANGKNNLLYHSTCLGLVLKGYAVLAFDPTGQGERIEYVDDEGRDDLDGAVDQHYYLGRPLFLLNNTLSGLRLWDAVRALDYLASRPEVDTSKIAAVGNSGGGQMALLVTAVDKRIKVCAAGHPGGQMEKNYLKGQNLIDRQIFSLIAPRPVRIIVGERSGEELPHRKKIEDIQLFMEGLGYSRDRAEIKIVEGVHDMRQPKREAAYEWLNRWFHKEEEGKSEPPLNPEDEKNLWATKSGLTLVSLGGETGQTLNAQVLEKIYKPVKDPGELKKRIAARIGLNLSENNWPLNARSVATVSYKNLSIEKLTYQSEEGITIPSLLIKPKHLKPGGPVYIYASGNGKPQMFRDSLAPFQLAEQGYVVLAIDVRGIGEISPTASLPAPVKRSSCTPLQWIHDCLAIQSPGFGRTMLGMRTYDLIRGIDFLESRKDLQGREIVLYGEGQGGLWALLASIYNRGGYKVITENTLASYRQLVSEKYYTASSDYFWLPGALCDFDIPDLARLASSKVQLWINPVNGRNECLKEAAAASLLGAHKNIKIVTSKNTFTFPRIIQP
ncbi:MAG TPA: acetylxylan esterase, partial [Flavisolibacter sp.]|nr:acetylxylan esterase [Flavisolibacter sp.]